MRRPAITPDHNIPCEIREMFNKDNATGHMSGVQPVNRQATFETVFENNAITRNVHVLFKRMVAFWFCHIESVGWVVSFETICSFDMKYFLLESIIINVLVYIWCFKSFFLNVNWVVLKNFLIQLTILWI